MKWLLCRLNNEKQKLVPAWSALQEITTMKPRLCGVNVIPHPPTKFETIYMILQSGYDYMKKLELEYIFIECDQAVYHKILEVKFNLLRDRGHDPFEGIIVGISCTDVLNENNLFSFQRIWIDRTFGGSWRSRRYWHY